MQLIPRQRGSEVEVPVPVPVPVLDAGAGAGGGAAPGLARRGRVVASLEFERMNTYDENHDAIRSRSVSLLLWRIIELRMIYYCAMRIGGTRGQGVKSRGEDLRGEVEV